MTSDPLLLAPALVSPDLTAGDLLALAGFPAADIPRHRENLLRRWKRAGLIEGFGVRLSGRPPTASNYWSGAIIGLLESWFIGAPTVKQLAHAMHSEDDATGGPTRALEHAIEAAVEDGWLLPVRAVCLTPAGRALVEGCPAALEIADRERQARESAAEFARLSEVEAAALRRLDPEAAAVLALAEVTRRVVIPRASAEDHSRLGLPARTVPRHRGRAHALSGGDPTWPVRARGGRC